MTGDHIGRSLRRLEDGRFLRGQGRYVDDIAVPGQPHGVVLRSPHGHASIEGIDAAAARTRIELAHLTPAQRRAYVIADNKLALNAGWDDELLKIELGELKLEGCWVARSRSEIEISPSIAS